MRDADFIFALERADIPRHAILLTEEVTERLRPYLPVSVTDVSTKALHLELLGLIRRNPCLRLTILKSRHS